MTIDQAIIRAAECAAEDKQTFYVYSAGPLHFVSPHEGLREVQWLAAVRPTGTLLLRTVTTG